MDLRTVMLMMATGSFLYAVLLVIFNYNKDNQQKVPYWTAAKFLQGAGSLMLYYRTSAYDGLTVLANAALLLGCAYEAWAVGVLTGKPVKRRLHILASIGILIICLITMFIARPYRSGLVFLVQSFFYLLPGLFLFQNSITKLSLQSLLAVCYSITGSVFLASGILCFGFPGLALSLGGDVIFSLIPGISFCVFMVSGFILLMLAKERSDRQVAEIQKSLEKSEIRFQQIVETAIEGILIFDENYRITFANEKMASILGYTVEEMIGEPYISFFPESQLDIYRQQESLRKKGQDSVYECCLRRKDGRINWFLVSATAILDEDGQFNGSFAMLTDINDRKEMELLLAESNRRLTELSNTDSLTGIANRRCFDAVLEREYFRLRRTNSKLSVILLDIDNFKEYNDYYGHVMGDECLQQIGRVLAGSVNRSVDLAARYGGEEFACILPDTDLYPAVKIAERIQQRIQALKIEHKKSIVSKYVTASFGVATVQFSPEVSLADIIAMADKLLYSAKVSGKNTIKYAEMGRNEQARLQENA